MSGLRSCLILDQLTHEKEEYRYPRQRARAEGAQRFALCKRSGFLAALVMTDGVRFAAAFGGRAFQVAVARPGSADEASLKRNSGGCGRRLLRPRWATIAPTSDAGEDQLISEKDASLCWTNGRDTNGQGGASKTAEEAQARDRRVKARIGFERRRIKPPRPPLKPRSSKEDGRVMGFSELNSYRVDPRLVRHSVEFHLRKPKALTVANYLCLAMASGRYCDIHLVTHVCDTARSVGFETDVRFMTNVINAATQNARWLMAAQLLQVMRNYGLTPNEITHTSILSRMSRAKQHHLCIELMTTEGLEQSRDAYNALISGCAKSRNYDRAIQYFRQMIEAGVKPDAMTFSSLVATSRVNSHEGVERAFETIELMRKEGLKVSTQCMNTLMGVCVQAREPNTALQVFRSMDEEGIPKDMITYNTAIAAYDKLRDGGAAVQLLIEAGQKALAPDSVSYNSVISALGHSKMFEEALMVFNDMTKRGLKRDLMTYNTIISACVRGDNAETALEIFGSMVDEGIGRDQYSYAGALHACRNLKDWQLSVELLVQMENMGMPANAFSYATAISTCARCGQSKVALQVYAQLRRLGIVPNDALFMALLEAFAVGKLAERAAWVLDEMSRMQIPVTTGHLELVLEACTNETDVVVRALRTAQDQGSNIEQSLFEAALHVCTVATDAEAATVVVEMMASADVPLRPRIERRIMRECFNFTGERNTDSTDGGDDKEDGFLEDNPSR